MATDPQHMDRMAKLAFAPIYPYLAGEIVDKFGIREGVCVDIGSGPGSLAVAMARITDLCLISLDIQPEMSHIARDNIAECGFSARIYPVTADVCGLPFENGSVDLVVSRGSLFFWHDRSVGFREIYRILRPGGAAYCGGGLGNAKVRAQVMAAFSDREALQGEKEPWQQMVGQIFQKVTPEDLRQELAQAQVPATVSQDDGGLWVQILKT